MSDQDAGTTTPEAVETATEDTSNAPTGAQDAAETSSDDQDTPKPRRPASDDLKNDLVKERRQRQALEKRLKEIEDAKLSDLERLQKQAKEATDRAEKAERESMRQRVALKHGIPAEDIHRIHGDTEDELDVDAASFAKRYTKTPRPDPSQGSRGGNSAVPDMNAMIRRMAGFH